MDEDIDEEGEGTVGLRASEDKIDGHVVYRDAFGNYYVRIDGEDYTAPTLGDLQEMVSRWKPMSP